MSRIDELHLENGHWPRLASGQVIEIELLSCGHSSGSVEDTVPGWRDNGAWNWSRLICDRVESWKAPVGRSRAGVQRTGLIDIAQGWGRVYENPTDAMERP